MIKKSKIFLTSIIGILLVLVLTVFIFLIGIRGEFTKYLEEKYPELSFKVGFTIVEPIYGNFIANIILKLKKYLMGVALKAI